MPALQLPVAMVVDASPEEKQQVAARDGSRIGSVLRAHGLLVAALFIFLLLGLLYSRTFPPFEGPDEPQHLAYIRWLVTRGGFPPQGDAAWETPVEQEAGQPPLYYLLASLPARLIGFEPDATYRPNPHFIGPFPRDSFDNEHRAIRYPGDANPLSGGWLVLYVARGITLLFGLLLIIAVYLLARETWPGRPALAGAAALLVALTPQVLFLSGVVSNDIPAAALSTLVLWQVARLLRHGATLRRGVLAGGLLGLAVLAKVSAFVMAAPLGLALFWLWWRGDREDRQRTIYTGFAAAGAAFLVAGWWFVRNWLRYGSPLGLGTHDRTSWAIRDAADLATPVARWLEVFRSFWVGLGWGTIRPPGWVYSVLGLFVLLAIAGLFLLIWRRRQQSRRWSWRAVLHVLLLLSLFGVMLFLEVWMRRVSAPYGRLLFPAIGAVAVLLLSGWHAVHPRLVWVPVGFLGLWAVLLPLVVVPPAYSAPEPMAAAAAENPVLGWRFTDADGQPVATLLRATPLVDELALAAEHNQTLPVELCWQALAQTDRPYTVFVHVIGPENALIANRRTYPGLGLRPTQLWEPGDVFCDLTRVLVRTASVERTLAYQIEVGLLDEEQDRRLSVEDQVGNPVAAPFIGRVRLAVPETQFAAIPAPGPLSLLDYELSGSWQAGETEPIRLSWGVVAPVERDLQTYVHLQDPAGDVVAQADGPPLGGWYPTSWWRAGEVVTDARVFSVPPELPAGEYKLVVGFYDLGSGERVGGSQVLGPVEVRR